MFRHRGRKYYSAEEASRKKDISVEWWRAQCRGGHMPGAFYEGGAWWIPAGELRLWKRIGRAMRRVCDINQSIEIA